MKVQSVFHEAVACLGPRASLKRAAGLMRQGGFGSVAVYQGEDLIGIITETDLVRAIADGRDPASTRISQYMSEEPAVAGPEDDSREVAERMVAQGFRHLPVVEEGKLVGMVSARDLLQLEAWPPAHVASTTEAMGEHPLEPRRGRIVHHA